jgi:hypothetical protein
MTYATAVWGREWREGIEEKKAARKVGDGKV